MKVRVQVPKPCERKGDSILGLSRCECLASCKKQNGYLRPTSTGTIHFLRSQTSAFQGCLPLEDILIQENLIRYESREIGGLEVLFEGVESAQNLNSEIFEDDGTPTSIESFLDTTPDLLTDKRDNDRKLKTASFSDKGLRNYLPDALGFAASSASAFFSCRPENVQDSFFQVMYARGDFDFKYEDIQNVATCLYHRIDVPQEIKKIWPRYTEKRHQETIAKIWVIVRKKMPFWAKRFGRIWDKLTTAQADALRLEWFYTTLEKPTQEESANKLGISVASYQERLEWAYKKLQELYPEFPRRRRKSSIPDEEVINPAPLYKVLPSGEKVQIEFPVMQVKDLTLQQKHEIKKWVYESSINYMFRYQSYTDVEDLEDEEEQEAVEEYIEKEHEDYLRLKTEESDLKQKAGL
ncbi:MAG TPA: hypothetical protein VNJ08_17045 [Bacteriovoracaceae bacterium]|nr:hypothetical protein [Bacteriovoracaceae bacterium]